MSALRETLLSLAERVEAASGADRILAKDIFRAMCPAQVPKLGPPNDYGWREDDGGWWLATGEDARTPPKRISPPTWLTSLDAAMSLVPEGRVWSLHDVGDGPYVYFKNEHGGHDVCAFAVTPALALTAAALRAHASQSQEPGK